MSPKISLCSKLLWQSIWKRNSLCSGFVKSFNPGGRKIENYCCCFFLIHFSTKIKRFSNVVDDNDNVVDDNYNASSFLRFLFFVHDFHSAKNYCRILRGDTVDAEGAVAKQKSRTIFDCRSTGQRAAKDSSASRNRKANIFLLSSGRNEHVMVTSATYIVCLLTFF